MFQNYRNFSLETGVKSKALAVFNTQKECKVLLHQTTVFSTKQNPKNIMITLNDGGWDTQSTRIVMNQALSLYATGFYLFRRKKINYLIDREGNEQVFQGRIELKVPRV